MPEQSVVLDKVRRYWEYAGADVDRAHEICSAVSSTSTGELHERGCAPSGRGLVSRRRNPVNRRFYQVTLTDQGRSVTSRLVASMHTHHARLLDAMTQAERDALATGVAALLRAMGQTPPLGARFPTPATSSTPLGGRGQWM